MFLRICSVALVLTGFTGSVQAETKRQLEAHEHGHGKLNIAIEGQSLVMELEVPGADIVGFEHAATSDSDKAAIETARKSLAKSTSLFSLPEAAGCALSEAKVALSSEREHHDKGHTSHELPSHGAEGRDGVEHTEFHVEYAFKCAEIGALGSIGFLYFDQFPNAEELDVTLITDKGQKEFEVNRDRNRIDLHGMM